MINTGDKVRPKTEAGLRLTDTPVDGAFKQKRKSVITFLDDGKVIATKDVWIDYSKWGSAYKNVGRVKYRNCLIRCEDGVGWAGEGALIKC